MCVNRWYVLNQRMGNQSRASLSGCCVQVGQVLSDSQAACFECLSFLATPPKHGHGFCYHISLTVICFSVPVLFTLQGSGGPYQGE